MKLVEEIGEVAELLNIRTGRKDGEKDIKEVLWKRLQLQNRVMNVVSM